jgi:DNA-binding FadR family transcriptional regulator
MESRIQELSKKPKKALAMARIVVPKPQEMLANQLRDSILKREIAEGESLPSERELVEQTGLTRGAVREALRLLSAEGLIQTTHGRSGGSIVTLPGREQIVSAIHLYVQGRRISVRSLLETRDVLEPFFARLAAERRTEANLIELRTLHEELVNSADNFQHFAITNVKWHNAVALASGNELLYTLWYSIAQGLQIASMAEEFDTPETLNQVIKVHARINKAIEDGNPEIAERYMAKHMGATHVRIHSMESLEIPLGK